MTAESIQVLEAHKQHWITLRDAGYIKQLEHSVKKQLEKVYQDELNQNYHENLWCGECVANMIRILYTAYEKSVPSQNIVKPKKTKK